MTQVCEMDLVDELTVAEVYPAGNKHAVELERMYIRSLAGSFSSRLLDFRTIGGTFNQIVPTGSPFRYCSGIDMNDHMFVFCV